MSRLALCRRRLSTISDWTPWQFITGAAGKFISNIATYLGPVIDVAEKLSAPIPGVGTILERLQLGGTLIDIIAGPGSPTATAVKQVAALGGIVKKIDKFANAGGNAVDFISI